MFVCIINQVFFYGGNYEKILKISLLSCLFFGALNASVLYSDDYGFRYKGSVVNNGDIVESTVEFNRLGGQQFQKIARLIDCNGQRTVKQTTGRDLINNAIIMQKDALMDAFYVIPGERGGLYTQAPTINNANDSIKQNGVFRYGENLLMGLGSYLKAHIIGEIRRSPYSHFISEMRERRGNESVWIGFDANGFADELVDAVLNYDGSENSPIRYEACAINNNIVKVMFDATRLYEMTRSKRTRDAHGISRNGQNTTKIAVYYRLEDVSCFHNGRIVHKKLLMPQTIFPVLNINDLNINDELDEE